MTEEEMEAVFSKAPEIYQPSLFWQNINKVHRELLWEKGYDNFKRTLNLRYFNFIPSPREAQFRGLIKWWITHPTSDIFSADLFSISLYKMFVLMLYQYTKSVDRENLLEQIEEPLEGNPFRVYYKGRLVTQDLCNSILEYYSATEYEKGVGELVVGELGAGYGRTAYVFLRARRRWGVGLERKCKYVIFDIPPALWVAQRYLNSAFPGLKVFKFRDFSSYEKIRDEYEDADLAFFTPNQMSFLPAPQFNLFLNISSLQEMRMEQIRNYLFLIDRYTRGYFYTKQWLKSVNKEDGLVVTYKDYPVLERWKQVFFRKHSVQSDFFEALYEV